MNKKSSFTTKTIAYIAVFVALSVVINTVRVGSVSFGGFPIILSGYALGPVLGFVVGFLADLVGFIIRPSSNAFNPIFALTSALTGAIPVIVTAALGDKYPKFKLWKIIVGIFVGQFITSVVLAPMFATLLYAGGSFKNGTFWPQFLPKFTKAATKQAYSIPVYGVLVKSVMEPLTKLINFRETNNPKA